ncbi:MAG: 3-phosphoshikimate 1-carboxyvinyltransferase [Clostridia bacterium]|nr:3-phosphoshikimate 1-carboxyvinyltransferase [Clostridia bacterium]
MNVKIEKSKLSGSIKIPASKSLAHRVLIASALSNENTVVSGKLVGNDVFATMDCLKSIGAYFEDTNEDELLVKPYKYSYKHQISFNAVESGSTLRFLLPIVSALGLTATFTGEGRLGQRPIGELLTVLTAHGVHTDQTVLPVTVSGKLEAGEYIIQGGISSQYISGLLFALPLLDGDSTIEVVGDMVSASYIDMTLSVLKTFGISIVRARNIFIVKGNQNYQSPQSIQVEGDWSSAGFFAVGGALSGDVTLCGLASNSLQGDMVILNLLKNMGADITETEQGITVKKSELSSITFSAENCPDLVPIMSVALANANGISKVTNVERLRLKESDRLYAVIEMLTKMGVRAEYRDSALYVYGGEMSGNLVSSFNDHRIAMSATIAGTVAQGKTTIVDAECVKKSYPTFFSDHKQLGGKNNAGVL